MADNAFDIPSAPSSGSTRQFGALAGLAKLAGVGKKSGGLSARDHSNLMRQQAGHAIDSQLVSHVLGETAADSAHKRTMSQARLAHKQKIEDRADAMAHAIGNVPEGHVATKVAGPGFSASYAPKPEKPQSPAVSLESPSTKGPQFRARGSL